MSQFLYQQKQAWAGLKKKPGFVSAILMTMGTTLGALLCILTLAYVLIAKPLPYPEQDSLFKVDTIITNDKDEEMGRAYTYPNLIHLYENQTMFSETALLFVSEDVLINSLSQPTLQMSFVTPEYFSLLGAKMALGRSFEATEAKDTNNPVAIISQQTWQTEYAKDPQIIGKKMDFSGTSFTIVGVLSDSFIEPELYETGTQAHVFLPWDYNHAHPRARQAWGNINDSQLFLAKKTSAMTIEQVNQTLTTLVNDKWRENVASVEFFKGWNMEIDSRSFKHVILGDSEQTVFLLLAGVIGLVLIACANIANLFISRTAEQQRQLAIRAAVGARKSDLFKTIFAETNLLMMLSVAIALVLSSVGFFVMKAFLAAQLPRVNELAINWFTLSSAVLIALLLALFFARLSTRMINYKALNSTLQSSGKGTGIQVSKSIRKLLIISQVAIVTSLVFINISLFQDAKKSIQQPLGFTTENLATLSLSISSSTMPPREELMPIITELKNKLLELPQVKAISQSSAPLNGFNLNAQTALNTNIHYVAHTKHIDNNYFDMVGQTVLEGDNFSAADIKDHNRVILVNDVYAKQLAPEGSAIGQKIEFGGDSTSTIIGVVQGTLLPGRTEIPIQAYRPGTLAGTTLTLQLEPGQEITREQAVKVLKEVTNQFTVFNLVALDRLKAEMLFTQYTTAITSAVLAILTIILSTIGLYGILSYSTQMRSFEIGTRMAIGAKRKDLIKLIIRENSTPVAVGVFVSILAILALYIGFDEELVVYASFQLVPVFLVTVVLISLIALFACYWPLRQFINRPAIHSLRGSE
ncbi:ABC transporter permease [Psychrobium sp. 1_MG-2023]|uniref:ABC transporter permease n=1 Tax=Psychrobium sp. 1_MG-2023 TaxID=3062624 RepID=UPI000C32F49E|nr:ABC transporter permease [Psychrobium sp. 1_MG-2023]MDP2562740.1 ABC transporter permease [Psychrobium sp. 1_MG-2023]PKF54257.1 hypothetical protein CW748_16650 [Alteromonadales bacterium alter-6D02]